MEMNLRIIQENDKITWNIENEKEVLIGSQDYSSLEAALKGCSRLMKQLAITLKSIKIDDRRKENETNCENTTRGSS